MGANARLLVLLGLTLTLPSCARVALEGGEKPIHIVMDINIRVDRELDEFFAFEQQYRNSMQPATQPATQPAAPPTQATDAAYDVNAR